MPPNLIFLIVTAIVGGLLVLGASLAAVRERSAARFSLDAGAADGQGKYEPDAEIAEAHAGASASASIGVVRVLWWITIAAVLVGVGLSDAYRANQTIIFGLGGLAVVVVVVLHELMPRTWRNDLTTAADVYTQAILPTAITLDPSHLTYSVTWNKSNKPLDVSTGYETPVGNTVTVTVNYQWFPEMYLIGPFMLSSTSTAQMAF